MGEQGKGLIILYTGDGKGKSSAALGLLVRARGWQMRVRMYQFIKREGLDGGEHRAARDLGVEIRGLGRGFTRSGALEEHRRCAQEGWRECRLALADPECDAVILDELTYPVGYGWLPVSEVLEAIRSRPAGQHVVITGRNALPELLDAADLVTEMREVKHPQRQGVPAQRGVEF